MTQTSKALLSKEIASCLCLNCVVPIKMQASTDEHEDLTKLSFDMNNKLSFVITNIDILEQQGPVSTMTLWRTGKSCKRALVAIDHTIAVLAVKYNEIVSTIHKREQRLTVKM